MAEFKSWRSFKDFTEAVVGRTRYIRDSESEDFLNTVVKTAGKHVEVIPSATLLWRAQLGCDRKC